MWKDYTNLSGGAGYAKVHCWGGNTGDKDYEMTQVEGESSLAYCDIDDGWTNIMFYRCGSDNALWTKTFDYNNIGSNNYFKIKNESEKDSEIDKYKWDYAQRWTPSPAIDGLLDPNNPHNQAFDGDGVFTATLDAHTTYQFKILDGSTAYGLDNNVWTSSISDYTLNSTGYDLRLCTAGAGTYTFTYNNSTHQLSVAYPIVDHPNLDYCYLIDYTSTTWSKGVYIHFKDPSTTDNIAGTTWCGTQVTNKFELGGKYYFYYSPGDYPYFNLNEKGDGTDQTGDKSANWGKYLSYNTCTPDAWDWCDFTVRIQLENKGATTTGTEYQDIVFNSAVLSDISIPAKSNYDFGGYWTVDNNGESGEMIIDADGHWIASIADYTDASKHWIHAGTSTTLYAKWNETPRTITLNVSPDGAGSISPSGSTTAYFVTPSGEITATPNPGWKFKEWQFEKVGENYTVWAADTYNSISNPIRVKATANATLTAVFEPRYCLVGGEITGTGDGGSGTESGMPGWENYNKPFNVVTNSPILATCSLTLGSNKNFYIMVRDKADGLSYGKSGGISLGDDASITFTDRDNKVLFYSNGGTNYTFKITGVDGSGRPTVSVERPHQMHFAHKRVDIDGNDYNDDLGGTLTATINGESAAHEQWFDYGSDVVWTATAETGYSLIWYTDNAYSNAMNPQPDALWPDPDITHDENIYAKFTEKATTVTISANNTRGGSITVGGSAFTWGSTKTAGVTTQRALVVTPSTGYNFTGWTLSSTPDFELQDKDSETDTEVTLAGLGNGSTGTLTANFAAKTYTVTLNDDQGGAHNGSATATYHTTTLSVSTHAEIDGWMRLGYWNTSGIKVTDGNGSLIANVENYTNSSGEWIYDGDVTLYAHWYRIVTLDKNGGTAKGSIGVDYKGLTSSLTKPTRSGYSIEGFYAEAGCTTKVMNPDGSLLKNVSGYTDSDGKWINKTVDKLYAKWIFIIYRTGDKSDDPRAQSTDVESYDGGTISEAIEYRMKVHTLDQWTSLCLPFTVNAVKVWDPADGPAYFDIVPYYRTGGKFYNGHYIIRTPKTATDLAIAEFDQWDDPTSATGYVPAANTPYIIQWHDDYFLNKYISFFGAAGQEIPTSMTVGAAPLSDNVVNVYGNDAMVSGSVAGAYMLEGDYGSDGAWLRLGDASAARTVLPFECYIRANSTTTTRYRILRRGAVPDDTPTGWDDVINAEPKTDIMVYTITGFPVARYYDCSFTEAAQRLHREQGEGIYILRSANESVKLMVGGQ